MWAYPKRARHKTWTSLHHFVPWFSGRSFKVWATGTVCVRGGEARGCGVNMRMESLSPPLCRPSPPPAHPPHQLGAWSLVSLGTTCWGGGSSGRDGAELLQPSFELGSASSPGWGFQETPALGLPLCFFSDVRDR